jgi:hypothetical protein
MVNIANLLQSQLTKSVWNGPPPGSGGSRSTAHGWRTSFCKRGSNATGWLPQALELQSQGFLRTAVAA